MAEPDDITSRFSPSKALEPDVLFELQSILRIHDCSVDDLFFKWDAYCIKMDLDAHSALSLPHIRNLKQSIQDDLEKAQRSAQVRNERRVTATPKVAPGGDVFGMLDGLVPSTPATGGKANRGLGGGGSGARRKTETLKVHQGSPAAGMKDALRAVSGTPVSSFADRINPGEVIEILNAHLARAETPAAPFAEPRIKLTAASDQRKMAYRPLAMKLSEASEVLDDRIDDFMTAVQEHHRLDDSAFGSAASQSTAEVVAVGRIASDSMEGKLNLASLVLETSRRTGMGLRVPLKMDSIRAWSFFPGQIVALRGNNATGNEFVVKEVLDIPLLPSAASAPSALLAHREKLLGNGSDAMESDAAPAPLHIFYAAGPYTADDNLEYEPLQALCSQAAGSHADALILAGPFIDVDHPLVAIGDFDLPEEATHDPDTASMSTVFKHLFAPALNRACSANPHLTVVLVPSVRDVLDKHVSWPQDIIPRKELGLHKSVRIVSNPMILSMNETVMGISSQDVLYELRNEELSKAAVSGDLMGRLCRYLVEQRHFFPLFPPTDRTRLPKTGTQDALATGTVVDLSYLKLGEMVNVRPDVMLVPSALPPFAKVVESVLAINPGSLSKRKGAGTFARMTLHAPIVEGESDLTGHRVFDRARVEIVRI